MKRIDLSLESRRINAKIADAVMRAEAEGIRIDPSMDINRSFCPLGVLLAELNCVPANMWHWLPCRHPKPAMFYSREVTRKWATGFAAGFDGKPRGARDPEAYHLGRCYRERALRAAGRCGK